MNEPNGLNRSRLSSESQDLGAKIAATLAAQVEEFDGQFDAIISQVSDVYVLNIIAAKKHEFILELIGAIEQKMNEQMSGLRDFQIGVANNLISGLSNTLVEETLIKEKATSQRIKATPAPSLKLVSYEDILEKKRNQYNKMALKSDQKTLTDVEQDVQHTLSGWEEDEDDLEIDNDYNSKGRELPTNAEITASTISELV